nr:hypothetical protein Itr_chr12CG18420 [Ipomoea trifida]
MKALRAEIRRRQSTVSGEVTRQRDDECAEGGERNKPRVDSRRNRGRRAEDARRWRRTVTEETARQRETMRGVRGG